MNSRSKLTLLIFILFTSIAGSVSTLKAAVILQYHHVDDSTPPSTSISPSLFEKHLEHIEEKQFAVWPLPKLVKHLRKGIEIPDKVVVITFDDAYDSIYEEAYPLLKQRNWPFTVFVATQPIDSKSQPFMTWDQLREMSEFGATIANHTLTHAHLVRQTSKESKKQWLKRVESEIVKAESRIESELGYSAKLIAYPYGEFTDDILKLVGDLGYNGFGQQSGAVNSKMDLRALPRFPMTNIFGSLKQFPTKLASLPLAAKSVNPDIRVLSGGELDDGFEIQFQNAVPGITCFFGGQAIPISQDGAGVKIDSVPALKPGRSRINCTAPSAQAGRFYWYSYFWMRRNDDGSWYPEQ